jgi:hypothetical protein
MAVYRNCEICQYNITTFSPYCSPEEGVSIFLQNVDILGGKARKKKTTWKTKT